VDVELNTKTDEKPLYAEGSSKMVKVDSIKQPKLLVAYESEDGKRDDRRRSTSFPP
jgi:hypothetical protein